MPAIIIKGAKETGDACKKFAADLEKSSPELLTQIMEFFVEKAQGYAPVDTGYMRDHIGITENSGDRGVVTSEADYSDYVESGTSRQSPQPFMQPAIADTEREAAEMGLKWIQTVIKKHFR